MSSNYDEIFSTALALPAGSRAMLAEHLLESLDSPEQNEIDAAWAEEVERRVQDVQENKVETLDGKQVFFELRSKG